MAENARSSRSRSFPRASLSYAALILFAAFALYPVTRIVTIAQRPGDQLLSPSLALIPVGATFANFRILLFETPFLRWVLNSSLVAVAVTITGVALASTAGYALSRSKFLGRSSMLHGLLVTQMLPATLLLLPLYFILIKLSLINSYLGVIAIYSVTALPFCLWQLKGYYDRIPLSLEEAAEIDGATRSQSFSHVVFPIAAPALIVTAFFSLMIACNEYAVAVLLLRAGKDFAEITLRLHANALVMLWVSSLLHAIVSFAWYYWYMQAQPIQVAPLPDTTTASLSHLS